MKRFIVFLAVLCLAGTAWAHLPEGVTYYAIQFPDGSVPVMDGDLSDWGMVPDAYRLSNDEELIESYVQEDRTPGGPFDASELVLEWIVGWNETNNKLYFYHKSYDEVLEFDRPAEAAGLMHTDDCLEIMIDADNSGGLFRGFSDVTDEEKTRMESSQAQRYGMSEPAPDNRGFRSANHGTWTEEKGGVNADWGWSMDGALDGPGTLYYEVAITPWDDLNWEGPEGGVEHDLTEGEIIGCNLSYGDWDHEGIDSDNPHGKYQSYWTMSGGSGTTSNASVLADFLLMPVEPGLFPTAVESATWGRIKSTFVK
jgi:hypothetical protein